MVFIDIIEYNLQMQISEKNTRCSSNIMGIPFRALQSIKKR